jgi:DNA-binding NtrC family response regulator
MAFTGGRSHIDAGDLPVEVQQAQAPALPSSVELPDEGVNLEALISSIERDLITRSLERTAGNKGQAAKLLCLKRTTLVEKIKRLERL